MKGLLKFQDISILKKMLVILFFTFLLPLFLLSALLIWYLNFIDMKHASEQQLTILTKVIDDLNLIFQSTEEFGDAFIAKGLMWKFAGERESYRDFLTIAEMADDFIRSVPVSKSIILIRDQKVVFERGPALDSELPAYPDDIKNALRESEYKYWTTTRKMNYFFHMEHPDDEVLPLYRIISAGPVPLILFIGLNEQELCTRYSSYGEGTFFLVGDRGKILSATDKTALGAAYPPDIYDKLAGYSGYFRTKERMMILYMRGYNNWYIVNHIPLARYHANQQGSYVIVFLAAILGVTFAAVCLLMQRRYIFSPLTQMLSEMNEFRHGNLQPAMSYRSKDEIGQLNREVERVFKRVNDLVEEVYITKIHNQEATLQMLTSQINPHFLYNTLDSIRWKAIRNKDIEVSEQIEALASLFRHILSKGGDMVTVGQEITQLENYLYIMNFRYENRIHCQIQTADGVMELKIPKLILQPLVENAILHGLEPQVEKGSIEVSVETTGDLLRIVISDNGQGADATSITEMLKNAGTVSHNMFALKNIDQRIKLRYGSEYGMTFHSVPGEGTVVTLIMPVVYDNAGDLERLDGNHESSDIG
jgi:two-component system sensor histidine kinase YesM